MPAATRGPLPALASHTDSDAAALPCSGQQSDPPGPAPVDPIGWAQRVIHGGEISRSQARALLEVSGDDLWDLLYAAHRIRRHFHANTVTFCSIVAAKFGDCSEDCSFCAQSVHHNAPISARPMMDAREVVTTMRDAKRHGASAFGVVNQGRGPASHDWQQVLGAVRGMNEVEGTCRCASLGILTEDQARDLKHAGLQRYNHNLESSRDFYKNVCTTHTWDERYETVRLAKQLGLETCCGGIFGMGESLDDRVSLAFSLKELNPNVVPLNFLYPVPGTPMEHAEPLAPLEILKTIAVFRFVLPRQDLKVAGGRERNLRDLQSWIFYAGATSALVGNYLATFGRSYGEDLQMINDLGLQWKPRAGEPAPDATNVHNAYERTDWDPVAAWQRDGSQALSKEQLFNSQAGIASEPTNGPSSRLPAASESKRAPLIPLPVLNDK
jgi:biotin synthase